MGGPTATRMAGGISPWRTPQQSASQFLLLNRYTDLSRRIMHRSIDDSLQLVGMSWCFVMNTAWTVTYIQDHETLLAP